MSVKKIDIHVHSMLYPELSLPRPDGSNFATPDELIKMYDDWGIERGYILPEVTNECCRTAMTSEEACVISRGNPSRFGWFCNLSPRMGDNSTHTDFGRFLEHYKALGAKGVGEVCANLPFDDPMYDNMFYWCAEYDMPVIFHMTYRIGDDYGIYDDLGLPRMEKMLAKYPKLRLIGHSQTFWAEMSGDLTEEMRGGYPTGKVTEGRLHYLLRNYPNLYCDMSAGSGSNAFTRDNDNAFRFIEEFSDRLMYGTDICSPKNHFALAGWLEENHDNGCISDENYYKICRGNAIKQLKIEDLK